VAFIPSRRLAAEPGMASARRNVPVRRSADTLVARVGVTIRSPAP